VLSFAYNAAHQRRADALNTEPIYPDRAFAACACYALARQSTKRLQTYVFRL
jgi:hypothetical protein